MYKYTNKRSIQIQNYLGQSARIQGLATRGLGKSFLWLGYGLINSFKDLSQNVGERRSNRGIIKGFSE